MGRHAIDREEKEKRKQREEIDLRKANGLCIVCCEPLSDALDRQKDGSRYTKCHVCRAKDKASQNLRTVSVSVAEKMIGHKIRYAGDLPLWSKDEWGAHRLCSICGWELHGVYIAYGECPKCHGDYEPPVKRKNILPVCRSCEWLSYAGDGIGTCPSMDLTGPATKDCLRFECGRRKKR